MLLSQLNIRTYQEQDYDFIKSSWNDNLGSQPPYNKKSFFDDNIKHLNRIMNECNSMVLTSKENENVIIAYMFWGRELYYIYVKHPFRRMGLATEMLRAAKADIMGNKCLWWSRVCEDKQLDYNLQYKPNLFKKSKCI